VLDEQFDPDAKAAFERAVEAGGGWEAGGFDDLVLLESLVDRGDEDLLRVLGPYLRRLRVELAAERGRWADGGERGGHVRPLLRAEAVLDVAVDESFSLGAAGASISGIHLLLALFSFPRATGTEVLHRCGIEWRPLHSLARRLLGGGWW
jgi:hypothetical protein